MRVLLTYLLAAAVLIAAGLGLRMAGGLQMRAATAHKQILTLMYDAPKQEHDAIERDLQLVRQVPGISTVDADIRQQRATSRYWQERYSELAPASHAAGDITEKDPALLLLAANAAYRSVASDDSGPLAVQRMETLVAQYADALRRAPWQFDTAFNYEFIARRRERLVRARGGKTPQTARPGTAPAVPSHTIHGRAGAVPPGVDMSEFKVVVPQRSDERREQPEAGKGGPKPRKG